MSALFYQTTPSRVLVVAAHPDDIEFYAGGTLATWIQTGSEVHYLLVTDGAGGSRDPECTPQALAERRRLEQRRAADLLGVASVHFLGYPDAGFDASLELRIAIARVIRQVRPDTVVTFDPQRHYHAMGINHPDHIAVGASTLGAVMPLANTRMAAPALLEEGLEPHDVSQVFLFETATPSFWMPLSEKMLERKLAALEAHESQIEEGWDAVSEVLGHGDQLAYSARSQGLNCEQAEAFSYIRLTPPIQPIVRRAPVRQQQQLFAHA